MKILLFLFVLAILGAFPVFGQFFEECLYSESPAFNNKIYWLCDINESEISGQSCYSIVRTLDEGILLQSNPEPYNIEGVGQINSFEIHKGLVRPYFTKKNVRTEQTFNYSIICSNSTSSETFSANVTPKYSDIYIAGDRLIWLKDNSAYVVGGLLLIIFVSLWFLFVRDWFR